MAATIASLGGPSLTRGYGNSNADPNGTTQYSGGGQSSALNVTAATVVKASPGRLCKILVVVAPGTSGALTVNDAATTAAAATANEIFSLVYGSVTAGLVIVLDWPCVNGIVVSAVGGGTPQYSVSFN